MVYKLRGRRNVGGQEVLVDPANIGSANVVLTNVDCEASVYVGAAVVMNSSGVARNALADSLANSNVIGIVESKSTSVLCNIRVIGATEAIFAGLDETLEYYLSDTVAGAITTTIPITSGHVMLKLGQPLSETRFVVLKGQRVERA